MNIKIAFAACLTVLALQPGAAFAARVALVVGNAAYAKSPLLNPINDAKAISAKLRALGFTVTEALNLKRDDIGITIERFLGKISRGDSAAFFYAGHGVQVDGRNYLLATDASLQSQYDVPLNAIDVTRFLGRLENTGADVKLMFLDACRDNPFMARFRGGGNRGLARMGNAPNGTLISFATRPGGVAADGDGSNGLYTSQLLRYIDQPGLPVELMLKKVAAATIKASEGKQSPWVEGGITGDFVFKRAAPVQATKSNPVAPSHVAPPQAELAAWEIANANQTALGYQLFLNEYPKSSYAGAARMKIALHEAREKRELAMAGPGTQARSQVAQPPASVAAQSKPVATARPPAPRQAPEPAKLAVNKSAPKPTPRTDSPRKLANIAPSVDGGRVYRPTDRSLWEIKLTRTNLSIFVDRLNYLGEIGNGGGFDPVPPHEFVCSAFGISLRHDGQIEPAVCEGNGSQATLSGRLDRLKIELSNGQGFRERFAIPLRQQNPPDSAPQTG